VASLSTPVGRLSILAGTCSLFVFLFLLFVRFVPVVPIHEMKELRRQLAEGAA